MCGCDILLLLNQDVQLSKKNNLSLEELLEKNTYSLCDIHSIKLSPYTTENTGFQ